MQKPQKLVWIIILSLIVLTSLNGCSSKTDNKPSSQFPNKTITMIVPYSPGGSSDILARTIAKLAPKYLGQPIVIENKPGAAGTLGLDELVKANPDGYTIGITNSAMVLQPLYGQTKNNYVTDLQALSQIGYAPFLLVVKNDAPWKDLDEFIQYAKDNPGKIKYGHTGIGNTTHIMGEMLIKEADIKIEPVVFDGGSPLLAALLGGHIQAGVSNPVDIKEQLAAGTLRVLAVAGEERFEKLGDVPTFKEKGYDVVTTLWQGIGAPKGISDDVKRILGEALNKIINDPETSKAIEEMNFSVQYLDPQEFQEKWSNEQNKMKKVVEETGIMDIIKSQKK